MALLSGDWEGVALFPGAERVLAAQGSAVPQTDQFCGPFVAWAALHAMVESPPSMVELALACGTRVWPHEVTAWRPAGAPLVTDGWDAVPRADDVGASGTDAVAVLRGLQAWSGGRVSVEQITGPDWSGLGPLLAGLAVSPSPCAVIANVRTGPISPPGVVWDVGHFVVLVGLLDQTHIAVADSYAEMGAPGAPPGCRLVPIGALAEALAAPPGRSLIVLRPGAALDARG